MYFVFFFAVLLAGLLFFEKKLKKDWFVVMLIVGALGLLALIVWTYEYPTALCDYSKLTSYQVVDKTCAEAITQTANAVVILPDSLGTAKILSEFDVDVANFKHSSQTADRINDLKNMRVDYYRTLAKYRALTSNFFTRSFFPPLPESLKGK